VASREMMSYTPGDSNWSPAAALYNHSFGDAAIAQAKLGKCLPLTNATANRKKVDLR
jgi:hypothetical protein